MRSRKLNNAINREDQAEAVDRLNAADRTTCYPHQSWTADCADQHAPGGTGRGIDEPIDLDYLRGNQS
ncbi:hypothetical protein AB0L33_30320 [Streptomyces sp. NPDC052299]|uniref:hypothetical protein n=1 Tax=Streptomyces sp. NPDC052299 TaxID=3155054 RepID=UPI0034133CCE